MILAIDIQMIWEAYGLIFLLMLSTFLLGYFLASFFSRNSTKKAIALQKKELETLNNTNSIKDIETIFTEIKPKIIDIVKETQQKAATVVINDTITPPLEKIIAEKARSTYVSYTKNTRELDLSVIGKGTPDMPDDLTKIEGIGPYIEERLNTIGIYNYRQISKLEDNDIRVITELIDFFPGRIERDNWVGQADSLRLFRSKL